MDAQYNATLETLERLRAESMAAGGEEKTDDQHRKGKLTARERIDLLVGRRQLRGVRCAQDRPRRRPGR